MFSKKPITELITTNTAPIKISTQDKKKEVREVKPTEEEGRHWFTFKEMEEKKKIIFPNFNVPSMLAKLLYKNVIKLPECKFLEEWAMLTILSITNSIESLVARSRSASS